MTEEPVETTESRTVSQTVTVESQNAETEENLALLAGSIPYEADGYAGTLTLLPASVRTEAKGYATRSYTVSDTRTYPDRAYTDPSLIPQTVQKDGLTLTLSGVTWKGTGGTGANGSLIPTSYTATASYSGTGSISIIQSYQQLEKNYGKEGAAIIQDNCQLTIAGGFAPSSETADIISKALGTRTVMTGSVGQLVWMPAALVAGDALIQYIGIRIIIPDGMGAVCRVIPDGERRSGGAHGKLRPGDDLRHGGLKKCPVLGQCVHHEAKLGIVIDASSRMLCRTDKTQGLHCAGIPPALLLLPFPPCGSGREHKPQQDTQRNDHRRYDHGGPNRIFSHPVEKKTPYVFHETPAPFSVSSGRRIPLN